MNIKAAQEALAAGYPVRRKAWHDRKLVIASDPITGAPTRLIVAGDLCSPIWEPSDEDKQADDWERTGEGPVPLTGPREVL